MRKAAALMGLLLGILPVSASAHPGGLHTWSLYKSEHLKIDAAETNDSVVASSERLHALDATAASIQRRHNRNVSRLWAQWRDFDARYWESMEPEPLGQPATTSDANGQTSVIPSGGIWSALANCESGGDPTTNTGNGFYGAFQFTLSTWQSVGGSGYPHEHSYGTQLHFAQVLQARSGWGQWPGCAAKLGLL